MPTLKRLVYATLALLGVGAAKAQQEHWTNGASATGTTDPNVANDCTYWANNIASDATCEGIETYFGISHAELTTWVRILLYSACYPFAWLTGRPESLAAPGLLRLD